MLPRSAGSIFLSLLAVVCISTPGKSQDATGSGYPSGLPDPSPQVNPPISQPTSLPGGDAPPGTFLQGRVTVLGPGTHFRVSLDNTLDTTYTREGEEFQATVTEPVILNGQVAVPPGSKLTGKVTKVISPHNFNFGGNGRIDVKFVAVETPDGRKFPINASIDVKQLQAAGGVHSQGSRTASNMKHGAMTGLKYGAGAGALYGAATSRGGTFMGRNSMLNRSLKMGAMGALAGMAVGAGAGLIGSGVKKGDEVRVPVGTNLPVQLDEPLTMDATNTEPTVRQPAFGGYPQASQPQQQYGGGGYSPPQQSAQQSYGSGGSQPAQPSQQPYDAYPQQSSGYPQQGQQPSYP